MRKTVDAVKEYLAPEDDENVSAGHAAADYVLGHLLTNTIAGATAFAIMSKLLPVVPTNMLEFGRNDLHFGKDTPILFPLAVNAIPLTFGAIEVAIRKYNGSLATKSDAKIHTPFAQVMPFDRTKALFAFILMTGLQVNNGIINVFPGFEGRVTDDISKDFFTTSAAAFWGQMLLSMMAYAIAKNVFLPVASFAGPKLHDGAAYVANSAASGARLLAAKTKDLCTKKPEEQSLVASLNA